MIDALDVPSDWACVRAYGTARLEISSPSGDRITISREDFHETTWDVGYRDTATRDSAWVFSTHSAKDAAIASANATIRAADRKGVAAAKTAINGGELDE